MKHTLFAILALILTCHTQADELSDAAGALCARIKQCTQADMEANAMSPSAQSDVDAMLAGMCSNIEQDMQIARSHKELYAPATACLKSMGKSGCEVIQGEEVTSECQNFERSLRQFSDIARD